MPHYHSRDGVTSRLRLRGFDYSSAASYFVTICVERRLCLLGEIRAGVMHLSHAGVVIDSWWHSVPRRFPSVELDAMVVMPNHLHAVIHIGTDPEVTSTPSLPQLLHWFKNRSTYDYILGVRLEGWPRFRGKLWQDGYFDRIVRNDRELERIRGYIEANPAMWADDEENPDATL
jgi:REP element-mobilizing transposase RayT